MPTNNNRVKPVVVGVVLTVFASQAAWAWTKIVQNSETIAANIPPTWLVKQLDRIEARVDSTHDKIGGD